MADDRGQAKGGISRVRWLISNSPECDPHSSAIGYGVRPDCAWLSMAVENLTLWERPAEGVVGRVVVGLSVAVPLPEFDAHRGKARVVQRQSR